MSSYEAGTTLFKTAAATALTAALMIRQPWAFYVAAAMGTLISDPAAMDARAKQWCTPDQQGTAKDVDDLIASVGAMKKELYDAGKWDGGAYEQFVTVCDDYVKSLTQIKSGRNDTGTACRQAAKFYFMVAIILQGIALLMLGLGVFKTLSSANPATGFMAELAALRQGGMLWSKIRSIMFKQGLIAGGLATIFFMVSSNTEMSGKLFPHKAIPTEMSTMKNGGLPEFMNAGLEYDQTTGFTPKVDDIDKMKI
ncbi:hypothetical protein OIE66_34955 [Nonomuraea sp. NBC_01738]|uniref:WXG100 family type VII secretion target n=1 Tax=Nonomuraea sp. NBC_01738 TaxID=2976003 RepID=UPI002E0F5EB1|nr:hypothetical protein OIE66_34955 [Nonomuraea sp. NBC_01738]